VAAARRRPRPGVLDAAAPGDAADARCRRLPTRPRCRRVCGSTSTSGSPATSTRWRSAGSSAWAHLQPHVLLPGQRRTARRGLRAGQAFEDQLNKKLKTTSATKITVAFLPTPRDQLAPALMEGKIDCAVAQVVVGRAASDRDFTNPVRDNVSEVVVTGPAPQRSPPSTICPVRTSTPARTAAPAEPGRAERRPRGEGPGNGGDPGSPGNLEDDDLLEMVNAGLIRRSSSRTTCGVLEEGLHEPHGPRHGEGPHRSQPGGGHPKKSPLLAAELNAFLARNGLGTALGNGSRSATS